MATEEADLEPFVSVGCPVVFHSDPFSKEAPRYLTIIRGWRKPSYLLIDRPKITGRYAAIRGNQPCVVRFVREGKACAFDSLVLDWDTRQHNAYCRIEWPRSVKVVAFRKFERVKVQLPCRLKVGAATYAAEIHDLSIGGCRLQTTKPIEAGAKAKLHFTLPDGSLIDPVECVIRNAQDVRGETYLGCEFPEGQVCVESHIAFFITTTLERAGVHTSRGNEILVIDEDPVHVAELRRIFQDRGYTALVSAGMMDGLVRLRAAPPDAVLMSQSQKELSGLLAARLISMTPGLESLPIFLHDAREDSLADQARQMGVKGCFRAGTPPLDIVNHVVTHLATGSSSGA